MSRACIAGVGQRLAGDDGVGLAVVEHLSRVGPPPGIRLARVGEPGALLALLEAPDLGAEATLIVVDAVLANPAGRVLALDPSDVEARALPSVSSHGLSVGAVLSIGRALVAGAPRARIVAVTIAGAAPGEGLSPAVAAAVPRAAARALALALSPALTDLPSSSW